MKTVKAAAGDPYAISGTGKDRQKNYHPLGRNKRSVWTVIGKADYSVPYTAQMSEDKTGVILTLTPEPLKLKLSNDIEEGGPTSFEEAAPTEIEVEIIAQGDDAYTLESKNMGFRISAASVKVA